MSLLTVDDEDVIKTARLDVADATDIADAAFVVVSEQAAIEATIHPAALTDAAVVPLLLRCVVKLLAAELLDMRSREDGATGTFQGAGVLFGNQLDHAARLRTEARRDLEPYILRAGAKDPIMVSPVVPPSSLDLQDKLFGRTEADLRGSDEERD